MWTPATRKQHIRETSRYQTDVTDEEWRVIRPHLPSPNTTGRPRAWPMREIINGIFYVMRSGCPWRLLPSDLGWGAARVSSPWSGTAVEVCRLTLVGAILGVLVLTRSLGRGVASL